MLRVALDYDNRRAMGACSRVRGVRVRIVRAPSAAGATAEARTSAAKRLDARSNARRFTST